VLQKISAETLELNFNSKYEDIIGIDGFGKEMAKSFIDFVTINQKYIKKLIDIIKPQVIEIKKNSKDTIFKDKTVVLTGSMSKPRNEIKIILEDLGAKVSSSISKKTDFLIFGEKAGSKLEKAQKLKIESIEEKNFWDLV